jgi:hypothetical protein
MEEKDGKVTIFIDEDTIDLSEVDAAYESKDEGV